MKSLREPEPLKPLRITKALLEEWNELEEKRKELRRDSDYLGKRQKEIEAGLMPTVVERSGVVRRIESCGFELSIVTEKGYPKWQQEFIRIAGLAEANRLKDEAPTKDKLEIRKL